METAVTSGDIALSVIDFSLLSLFIRADLVVKSGKSVRVYDNVVVDNNFKNFAPVGNVVASVPTGTGIMVLATSDVEIYNNKI